MDNKRLVLDALEGKKVPHVPFGAWYGWYDTPTEYTDGMAHPEFIEKVISDHKQFIRDFHPDIVKVMNAGFFKYPGFDEIDFKDLSTLRRAHSLGKDHKWVKEQVRLTRELTEELGNTGILLYNIFSPFSYIRFAAVANHILEEEVICYTEEDPEAYKIAIEAVTADLIEVAKAVVLEGKADGIFLPVRNLLTKELTEKYYEKWVAPYEKQVLEAANSVTPYQVLHICGIRKNDFSLYKDYDALAFNWAVGKDHITLKEGKEIFKGKTVIGGLDNQPGSLVHTGAKEQIEAEVDRILTETGTDGVIVGFDCAVLGECSLERLGWARDETYRFGGK